MTCSFLGPSRWNLAFIAVATAAIAASACSTNSNSSASPVSHGLAIKRSTYPWNWVKVSDTSSGASTTEVTGISDLSGSTGPEIVGNNVVSGSTKVSYSFTSLGPDYNVFTDVSYTRVSTQQHVPSTGTQMNAIAPSPSATGPVVAGFVSQPEDSGPHDIFAVIDNQGLWSLLPELGPGGGKGGANSSYLFGINDSNVAVGSYTECTTDTYCKSTTPSTAFEVAPPSPRPSPNTTNVPFPTTWNAKKSVAYGINDSGDMVGTVSENSTSAAPVAWYALCINQQQPCSLSSTSSSYCWQTVNLASTASNITPYGINNSRQVVGSYHDTNGTHGFLADVATSKSGCQTSSEQYPIDVVINNQQAKLTVVHGINNAHYIVGWYSDSTSGGAPIYGFVGTLTTESAKRRRSRP